MITDSISMAHENGYLHGLILGGAFGIFIGSAIGFFVAALLHASAEEPPAPEQLLPGQRFARLMLDGSTPTPTVESAPYGTREEFHAGVTKSLRRDVRRGYRRPRGAA